MFRRFLQAIILVPIAGVLVAWAIANRQAVVVSFDPFDPANPAYAIALPLYLLMFAILIAGVVAGGIATWIGQGKWRKARARLAAELAKTRAELVNVKSENAKMVNFRRDAVPRDGRPLAIRAGAVAKTPPAA